MTPEPRRKDRTRNRDRPAGLEPAEESAPPPEEYTSYRERDRGDEAPEDPAAVREADLQPGGPEDERRDADEEPGPDRA